MILTPSAKDSWNLHDLAKACLHFIIWIVPLDALHQSDMARFVVSHFGTQPIVASTAISFIAYFAIRYGKGEAITPTDIVNEVSDAVVTVHPELKPVVNIAENVIDSSISTSVIS